MSHHLIALNMKGLNERIVRLSLIHCKTDKNGVVSTSLGKYSYIIEISEYFVFLFFFPLFFFACFFFFFFFFFFFVCWRGGGKEEEGAGAGAGVRLKWISLNVCIMSMKLIRV